MRWMTMASAAALLLGGACSPPQDSVDVGIGAGEDESVSWEDARPRFIDECEAEGLPSSACECLFRLTRESFDSVEEYAASTEAPPGFDEGARRCINGAG